MVLLETDRSLELLEENRKRLDEVTFELLNTYEHLAAIYESAVRLSMTRSISDAAQMTLCSAVDVTESSGGVLIIPRRGVMEVVSGLNFTKEVEEYAQLKAKQYPNDGRYEDKIQRRISAQDGRFLSSALFMPLQVGEKQDGILFIFSTDQRSYSSADLKITRVLAGQAALAVKNLVMLDELEEKNTRLSDALGDLGMAQKELIRAERFSALGEMSSMIVHDIKNPMSGLLGYAQLLYATAESVNPEQVREYSGLIIQEMRRLSNLTEEIMDFSRGVDSKLNLRSMEPRDVVNTAWPLLKSDLENHGMEIVRGNLETRKQIKVDSDKMERVLINLAVNARQAMDKGGCLTVSVHESDNWVEISLKDTGSGIPEDRIDEIFEPFVTRKRGHSLGIGLAMSRWIVQSHDGDIRLAETGADGTDMVVRLPAVT